MSANTLIAEFVHELNLLSPDFLVDVDIPDDLRAEHFLDIECDTFSTEVSFKFGIGFGVFVSDGQFGQRPDEIFRSPKKAAARIAQLKKCFETKGHLSPLGLAEIRNLVGLTQVELAENLGITQPSVQRAERQGNPKLDSIAGHVAAMGGRLETRVVFGDMEARIDFPRAVEA